MVNVPIAIFGILFVLCLVGKIIQNYRIKKKVKIKRKRILTTGDVGTVLFNIGLFTAGTLSIALALGFNTAFGESLMFTQPIVNFLAGVLFVWFAIRNIFYGGKI